MIATVTRRSQRGGGAGGASIPARSPDFSDIFGEFFGFGDLFGGGRKTPEPAAAR